MSVAEAPLNPQEQLQLDLYTAMAARLEPHRAADPRLVVLDYDPDEYPAQSLDAYCVTPKPGQGQAPLDWIDGIGRLSMGNYDDIAGESGPLRDPASDQHQWLRESAERRQAGESTILAAPHLELTGIAVELGTVATAQRRDGFEFKTALDFFRMMSVAGWIFDPEQDAEEQEATPCMDVAHMFTDYILQAVTQTRSTRQSGLKEVNPNMSQFVKANNKRVNAVIDQLLAKGNVMLGLAYNGAVWKNGLAERITAGTTRMMTHPNTHVLETNFAIETTSDGRREGYLEIVGPPRKLTSEEEVQEIGERSVETFNDRSEARGEGRPWHYETAEEAEAARLAKLQAADEQAA